MERLARGSALRILDSKEKEDASIILSAPHITDYLSPTAKKVNRNNILSIVNLNFLWIIYK